MRKTLWAASGGGWFGRAVGAYPIMKKCVMKKNSYAFSRTGRMDRRTRIVSAIMAAKPQGRNHVGWRSQFRLRRFRFDTSAGRISDLLVELEGRHVRHHITDTMYIRLTLLPECTHSKAKRVLAVMRWTKLSYATVSRVARRRLALRTFS